MDYLIRDLDDSTFRGVRARAALEGRDVGDLVTEALRAYLAHSAAAEPAATATADPAADAPKLLDETPAAGRGRDGQPIDEIVYLYCL